MSIASTPPKDRTASAAYCGALALITLAVYNQVRLNGFVWDTTPFVLQNPWLQHPGVKDIFSMFTQYYYANWQPMVWLSHALDFALFGHQAGLHHLSNLAYHIVDSCLVYYLVVRLLGSSSFSMRQREVTGFGAALIFAVHPQHVQSVAWLVERKDTLYVMFTLLCFISYLWVHRDRASGWRRAAPLALFALALMSKPMAVTVPVVLLLFDVYPLDRWRDGVRGLLRLVFEKWLYWLFSAGVIAVTLHTQQMAMVSIHNLPVWVRPVTAVNNSFFYVYCYLVPVNLSPFYPYATHFDEIRRVAYWLPGLAFLVFALGGGLWLWQRGVRWILLMVLFYLVTLLPVSGLIAVGPSKALDYYSYLATLPADLLLALVVVRSWEVAGRARSVIAGLAGAYLLCLCLLSFQQVKIWRNELTLWSRAYQLYPESAFINRNLAGAYFAIGDYDLALLHAQKSADTSELGRQYLNRLVDALNKMDRHP